MMEDTSSWSSYTEFSNRFKRFAIEDLDIDKLEDKNPVKDKIIDIKEAYDKSSASLNKIRGYRYLDQNKFEKGFKDSTDVNSMYDNYDIIDSAMKKYGTIYKQGSIGSYIKSDVVKDEIALQLANEASGDRRKSRITKNEFLAAQIAQDLNNDKHVSIAEKEKFENLTNMEQEIKIKKAFEYVKNPLGSNRFKKED